MLAEAGSGFDHVVKVNIFITTMDNFAKMNEAWDEFFTAEIKPVSHVLLGPALSRIGMGAGRLCADEDRMAVPHLCRRVSAALQCPGRD